MRDTGRLNKQQIRSGKGEPGEIPAHNKAPNSDELKSRMT